MTIVAHAINFLSGLLRPGARQDSAPADVTVPWHAQDQRFDSNPLALQPAPKVIKQATCQSRSGLKPPS